MSSKPKQQSNSFGEQLGLLYKRWVLDCIPNLGHAVSLDFSRRPELYKGVADQTATLLTKMQGQYGYAPEFPNKDMRLTLMKPIFGASDGHPEGTDKSGFHTARMPVLAAAAGFAENAQPTAFPMHRERIRSAIVPLRRLMEDLEGASLNQTDQRMSAIFETAASILRDSGVAAVFGIRESIDADWPLISTDADGAKLIEKLTTQLPDMPYGVISRDNFVNMQRVGDKGSRSISEILDSDIETDDGKLDQLTAQLYAWGSDLKLVGGVRAQK